MSNNMNKLAMPSDEMVEGGMTPQAREEYRKRMAIWREQPEPEIDDAEENNK